MAVLDLGEIMQRWLVARYGGELPTEPGATGLASATQQLALPLQWDGPDLGVYYTPRDEPLKIRRRVRRPGKRRVPSGYDV